jgi:hypothetical protein
MEWKSPAMAFLALALGACASPDPNAALNGHRSVFHNSYAAPELDDRMVAPETLGDVGAAEDGLRVCYIQVLKTGPMTATAIASDFRDVIGARCGNDS